MIDEEIFLFRSWLNVLIIFVAVIRLRSAAWMLDELGVLASLILMLLAVIGLGVYWLISKWGGR